jgi:retron-type reverse transcriptase
VIARGDIAWRCAASRCRSRWLSENERRSSRECWSSSLHDGYEWVVDIDLEKFFDRVNHQRLIARLAQRVADRRLLVLIASMLKAKVVLPDGVVIATQEGSFWRACAATDR